MAVPTTEPSELFQLLQQRPRASRVVDWPGRRGDGVAVLRVRIQILRMAEVHRARLAAERTLRQRITARGQVLDAYHKGGAYEAVLSDLVAKHILAEACLTENEIGKDNLGNPVYGRVFHEPEQLESVITADELSVLFSLFELVQLEAGPFECTLTDADMESWVERLAEGASRFPLGQLSWLQLADLTLYLCGALAQARRSSNGSETTSSPPPSSPTASGSQSPNSTSVTSSSGSDASDGTRGVVADMIATPGEVERLAQQLHKQR